MPSSRHTSACIRRPGPVGRPGRTTAAVLAAGASLALIAGCASAPSGSDAAAAGAAKPVAATSSAATPTLAGLAGRIVTAVSRATSVHVAGDLSEVSALPVHLGPVAGDVTLTNGRPTAANVTAGAFSLRHVGTSTWVTLPGAAAATPWTLVSPTSSNPIVAMAATRLAGLERTLSGIDPTALLAAASGLQEVGTSQVDGAAATQYRFTVDPTKLASALGVDGSGHRGATVKTPVPVQLWLDGSDRPVRVTASPTVDGKAAPVTVTLSAWDAPVSITAPPASQVSR